MSTKDFVFVPHWVQETLNRNNMTMLEVLNPMKVSQVLSNNDLGCLYGMDTEVFDVLGLKGACLSPGWNFYNKHGFMNPNKEERDTFGGIFDAAMNGAYKDEIEHRLFNKDVKHERYKEPFIIYDLTQSVAAVVINPGFFIDKFNMTLQITLIEAMLNTLYVYHSHSEVAKTQLFKRYLELLSGFKKTMQ